eukprot:COSAG02_NODE_6126_length_3783_cov_144.796417_2_plen_82_part_00
MSPPGSEYVVSCARAQYPITLPVQLYVQAVVLDQSRSLDQLGDWLQRIDSTGAGSSAVRILTGRAVASGARAIPYLFASDD